MSTGGRTIAYRIPPVAPFGDRFEATMVNREMEIGFGSKRVHFTMRSSRLRRATGPSGDRGGSVLWRAMGYVGCASLALGLIFVSGSMLRASPSVDPYAVVMPIDAKAAPVTPELRAKPRQIVRTKMTTSRVPATKAASDWSVEPAPAAEEIYSGIARPEPDVATLPTVNGERAVAVYGPARVVGGKSCRDVSVFLRETDGNVSVSPTTECKAAR